MMPINTVHDATYTSAAISTPPKVAIATLRRGSSTTAVATEALSSPVKAQNSSTSDCGMTSSAGARCTFQPVINSVPSKYHQTALATSRIGTSPTTMARDSTWHTSPGPRILTAVSSQMMPALAQAAGNGWLSAGTKLAREPIGATA